MNIKLFKSINQLFKADLKWDILFYGSPKDERGREIVSFLQSHCKKTYLIKYDPENFEISIDNKILKERIFFDALNDKTILIESTTLGLNEILKIFLNSNCNKVSIIYIQPSEYNADSSDNISSYRNFNLSDSLIGFYPIPERMIEINGDNKIKLAILLGYESYRIDRLFETFELNPKKTQLICGLPAYSPGWELNTFSSNINTLTNKGISNNINYCEATNPFSVYFLLEEIYQGLENDENLLIFPIGTKPHLVGAVLFLKSFPKASIVYDNPIEINERSKSIGNIYLYEL